MKRIWLVFLVILIFKILPTPTYAICSSPPCFFLESNNGSGMTSDPVTMEEGDTKAFIIYLNNDRGVIADTDKISAFQVELSIPSNLKLMVDSATLDYFPYDHATKYSRFRRSLLESRYQEWLGVGTTMTLDLSTTSICYNVSSRVDYHAGMNSSYLTAPQGFQVSGTTYLIHACGMPVQDYVIENYGSNRVFVGRFLLKAVAAGSTNITFTNYSFANSQASAATSTHIAMGTNGEQLISIGAAAPTATPTPTTTNGPTPTPTPTGGAPTATPTYTPTPTASNTPTPTPTGATTNPTPTTASTTNSNSGEYDLSLSDLNLVEITPLPTSEPRPTSELEVVEPDNTIPPPGEITPRPPATPFPTPNPNSVNGSSGATGLDEEGEVLAVQSIRDLLIPGKSQADKTVVLFNFISIITLLTIIAVVIWRLLMMRKSLKLKQEHIADIISGELATLETKLNVLDEKDGKDQFKNEFGTVMDMIAKEIVEVDNKPQNKGSK